MQVALDVDGTLTGSGRTVPVETVEMLELVRAAGHEVVLASGRSLVGLLPIARQCGLSEGYAVCSNGAATVRLDPGMPSGYEVIDAATFDPAPLIQQAQALVSRALVAVESIGDRWRVNRKFGPGLLNGPQSVVTNNDLTGEATTRVALHAPGIGEHAGVLASLTRLTVTPAGPDWCDATSSTVSKATAIEAVRRLLDIPQSATIAVGDGHNDAPLLQWAARGVAMRHAPEAVRAVADEVTGSIDVNGVVDVLRSLVPATALRSGLTPLAAQLDAAVTTATSRTPGAVVTVRVWHDTHSDTDLAGAELWTRLPGTTDGARHAPLPAARGATMRDIEHAVTDAGLTFPRGQVGRRRAHWHSTLAVTGRHSHRPPGFGLPVTPPS
ncbi:HAD family hydrolase [Myceligenerans pegani]|uniref:HAD family phosphatase n=1 Tax=Myceligenerans pegani TaxID=2776917 RepID=A0ABR9N6C8_9MICO|nr:HAD family hydrolase [Myceligenerans sp. TRM 65318]MBE1878709.1 HAD family phosphatase [Myceligenerans sp. TRM 65318]MBE3020980.1 HAD family phosphatase [Myceligenerans sp. TRM 65318]